jgi:predicted RNA-binding Zn ribbon-like protein
MHVDTYADRAVAIANSELPDLAATRVLAREQLSPWYARRTTETDRLALIDVRLKLRHVFADAAKGRHRLAVDRINNLLVAWPTIPRISGHADEDWHLHVTGSGPSEHPVADELIASAVYGLAITSTEQGFDRLGICADLSCGNVFLERNGGRPRRWCSDRCANRANVAAFRARNRKSV